MRVHGRLFAEMTTVRPEVVPFAMEPCIASSQEVGPVPLLSGSRGLVTHHGQVTQ